MKEKNGARCIPDPFPPQGWGLGMRLDKFGLCFAKGLHCDRSAVYVSIGYIMCDWGKVVCALDYVIRYNVLDIK